LCKPPGNQPDNPPNNSSDEDARAVPEVQVSLYGPSDLPSNPALPTHMVVATSLIYVTLDVLPTLLQAVLYLVPDKEWCVKNSRPWLDALEAALVITFYPMMGDVLN